MSTQDLNNYTIAELTIIQALGDGWKRFSDLGEATGYNDRWLSKTLKGLIDRSVVINRGDRRGKEQKIGYELDKAWKRQNKYMLGLIVRLGDKVTFWRTDLANQDSRSDRLFSYGGFSGRQMLTMLLPYFLYPVACVMLFYREERLYQFVKERALRLLEEYFESARKRGEHDKWELNKEVQLWEPNLDLTRMTFDECIASFRPASNIADHHRA